MQDNNRTSFYCISIGNYLNLIPATAQIYLCQRSFPCNRKQKCKLIILQEKVICTQKQLSCKNGCIAMQKCPGESCEIDVAAKEWLSQLIDCGGKNLVAIIQMTLVPIPNEAGIRLNELLLFKILPLTYYCSHSLATTCILQILTLASFAQIHIRAFLFSSI